MTVNVVDTNVILVANNAHEGVSPECVLECVNRLTQLMGNGSIAIDDAYRIVREYQHKTNPRRGKGVGDVFLKWVLSRLGDTARVQQVTLTELSANRFAEFPCSTLEKEFDPPDRMFVAVAHAHPAKPDILQAADSKWLDWWPDLATFGVRVEFLCPDDICRFYKKKFPKKPVPKLP